MRIKCNRTKGARRQQRSELELVSEEEQVGAMTGGFGLQVWRAVGRQLRSPRVQSVCPAPADCQPVQLYKD